MKSQVIIPKGGTSIRARAAQAVMQLSPNKAWRIEISDVHRLRTKKQMGLMWIWVNQVADIIGAETGYDADDIHTFFKREFLPSSGRKIIEIQGELYERFTTSDLSTTEMWDYMSAIDRWAVETLGVVLPTKAQAYDG